MNPTCSQPITYGGAAGWNNAPAAWTCNSNNEFYPGAQSADSLVYQNVDINSLQHFIGMSER